MKTIAVVIPAYNEAPALGAVLQRLFVAAKSLDATIIPIVVDDGSRDDTARIAKESGAMVIEHLINRGLGAALSTGIAGARTILEDQGSTHDAAIITFDADGQHDPAELLIVAQPIMNGSADVVLGSRALTHQGSMPLHRTIANRLANTLTGLLFGVWVSDTQSGYRGFSYKAATEIAIRTSTMEVSSEIVREIGRNSWRLVEVPITVAYTEYSLSKGQSFTKGLETLWKLVVLRFFR